MNSCIRNETSSAGRRQFSLLKANKVRYSTPASMQQRVIAAHRLEAAPMSGHPRQRRRFCAQRPLPSMMMAMWRGTASVLGIPIVELSNGVTVRGWLRAPAYTAIRSASLACSSLSISAM